MSYFHRKVNLQQETKEGYNPLQLAINLNKIEVVALILNNSSTELIHKQNQHGSALHVASSSGNKKAISLLFRYQADPLIKNKEGKFPIDLAADEETRQLI